MPTKKALLGPGMAWGHYTCLFVVVQSLSSVRLFANPCTAALLGSLSITNSWVYSNSCPLSRVMPSNRLILCHCLLLPPSIFPSIRVFSNESVLCISSQSIGASASVLPMNIQGGFPLGLTGLISLQSKGFSRVLSSTTIQKHQFFSIQPSLWFTSHIRTWLLERP